MELVMSGGQTGVDRGALDAAIELGIPHGGWCPAGRKAEDGPIPDKYRLQETRSTGYQQRTLKNIQDSDATLIFHDGPIEGGTKLTLEMASAAQREVLVINLGAWSESEPEFETNDRFFRIPGSIHQWIKSRDIKKLNVAGPRESKRPGIQELVYAICLMVFSKLKKREST